MQCASITEFRLLSVIDLPSWSLYFRIDAQLLQVTNIHCLQISHCRTLQKVWYELCGYHQHQKFAWWHIPVGQDLQYRVSFFRKPGKCPARISTATEVNIMFAVFGPSESI